MTTATLSETDIRVRDAVRGQLDWDPEVDASAVGVTPCAKPGKLRRNGRTSGRGETSAGITSSSRFRRRGRTSSGC